jgi:hypothetical protein
MGSGLWPTHNGDHPAAGVDGVVENFTLVATYLDPSVVPLDPAWGQGQVRVPVIGDYIGEWKEIRDDHYSRTDRRCSACWRCDRTGRPSVGRPTQRGLHLFADRCRANNCSTARKCVDRDLSPCAADCTHYDNTVSLDNNTLEKSSCGDGGVTLTYQLTKNA